MIFYLGMQPEWLPRTDVGLMVSRRALARRRRLPRAAGPWVLDSGGFTELAQHGGWTISARTYAAEVRRYADEVGNMAWAAPQDWMCEPEMIERTGLSIERHQALTVQNFAVLRVLLGERVIPVLQGYSLGDYLCHLEAYERIGADLRSEPVVGLGSVCRRSSTDEIATLIRALAGEGLRLHAFGVKGRGIGGAWDALASADSMAWSTDARWAANHGIPPRPPCRHRSCNNCLLYALRWRDRQLARLEQRRLWEEVPA